MRATSVDHDVLLHMPDAYSWIQVSGCQGHMGFDRVARTEWIRITRCMTDQNGEIVCTPLGDVPIEYFPDGEPGVSSAALAAILGTEPPWRGGVPAIMPPAGPQE
jgi:hypothetical protein